MAMSEEAQLAWALAQSVAIAREEEELQQALRLSSAGTAPLPAPAATMGEPVPMGVPVDAPVVNMPIT